MHANENDISLFVNCRLSDADKFTVSLDFIADKNKLFLLPTSSVHNFYCLGT